MNTTGHIEMPESSDGTGQKSDQSGKQGIKITVANEKIDGLSCRSNEIQDTVANETPIVDAKTKGFDAKKPKEIDPDHDPRFVECEIPGIIYPNNHMYQ